MATPKLDRTTILEATERHGVVVRVVRQARIVGLSNTDHQALFSALTALGITAGSSLTGAPNLILVERNPKIVDDGRGDVCDVDLVYEHAMNEGQSFDTPFFGSFAGEMRASLNQLPTNKDIDGNQIVLSHRYPNFPAEVDFIDKDGNGLVKTRGGEVQAMFPQRVLTLEGIKNTSTPGLIANQLQGAVNKTPWMGGVAHSWICMAVGWKPHGISPSKFYMTFEFQHNFDTWDPTAVFIDERTDKPPEGLVEGEGIQTITVHRELNFEALIGSRVQGG